MWARTPVTEEANDDPRRPHTTKTVAELTARGVEFTGPVADHGYGLVTHFRVPGGFEVQLYQPKYEKR